MRHVTSIGQIRYTDLVSFDHWIQIFVNRSRPLYLNWPCVRLLLLSVRLFVASSECLPASHIRPSVAWWPAAHSVTCEAASPPPRRLSDIAAAGVHRRTRQEIDEFHPWWRRLGYECLPPPPMTTALYSLGFL